MTTARATTIADAAAPGAAPARMLLTVAEVAAELGCCRDTVYQLLTTGALPSVRIAGRLRRIRRTDLHTYIHALAPSTPARRSPRERP